VFGPTSILSNGSPKKRTLLYRKVVNDLGLFLFEHEHKIV
jgi:hypothetical protein